MRRNRENQLPLSGLWRSRLAQELKAVSKILDDNPSILELVLHDLCDTVRSGQGARGLSASGAARGHPDQLSYTKGVPERLSELSASPGPGTGPPAALPAGEHQASKPPPGSRSTGPGPMGQPPGTGTGTQDSGRCHGRGKPHPLSAGFPVVVRLDRPHPAAASRLARHHPVVDHRRRAKRRF